MEKHVHNYSITSNQIDNCFFLRLDCLIDILQYSVAMHSQKLKIDNETLQNQFNAMWVITKMKLNIFALPRWFESYVVETWPLPCGNVKYDRDFLAFDEKGNKMLEGTSQWCIIDKGNRTLRKRSTVPFEDFGTISQRSMEEASYSSLDLAVEEAYFSYQRTIRYSDIDINRHTNNIIYTKIALDAFLSKEINERSIIGYEIHFLKETKENDTIDVYRKDESGTSFVFGMKENDIIFKASFKFQSR